MTKNEFCKGFIKHLNLFRKRPTSIAQKMETLKLGCLRLKSRQNSEFAKSIDKFAETLKTMTPCNEIQLNEKLSECCENYLATKDPDYSKEKFMIYGNSLKDVIPEEYLNEECFLFYDDSACDPEIFLIKMLINKEDTKKLGKNLLRDNSYTQVGIAYRPKEEDGNMVAIFAKNYVEPKKNELPDGDLSELKQAFDLFDVQKIGLISPKDTLEAMFAINYNEKNPELYKIMEELQNLGEMVDFPTFAWHVVGKISDKESKDGLRTIFNLYIDDFEDETISLNGLKKICRRLGEKTTEKEVEMLMNGKNSEIRLTFDDFYEFMTGKKDGGIILKKGKKIILNRKK